MIIETSFRQRNLLIEEVSDLSEDGLKWVRPAFVTVLFAYDFLPSITAETVAELVRQGCCEFCCVGPLSESLHDEIDYFLMDLDKGSLLTSWVKNLNEGLEYGVCYACLGEPNILVLSRNDDLFRDLLLAYLERIQEDPD